MSWVSQFIKKNLRISSGSVFDVPLLGDQLAKASRDELLRQIKKLNDDDFARVFEVVAVESARRTREARAVMSG